VASAIFDFEEHAVRASGTVNANPNGVLSGNWAKEAVVNGDGKP
jgi:hypothetical protein